VKDIRDGDKNKVFICHNGHTQSVSVNAVPSFITQGDLLGDCGTIANKNYENMQEQIFQGSVLLYPNPASNKAVVSFSLANNELVKISVIDAQGKLVMQPVMRNLKAGKQLFDINTSNLTSGLYFVQLTVDEHSSQLKLVVVH
jgi:type IX secretion system substrate protein